MARTKTQKALLKAERTGAWCAAQSRRSNGHYGAISQHVRLTPSKGQQLNKSRYKERIFQDDAPFHLQFEINAILIPSRVGEINDYQRKS